MILIVNDVWLLLLEVPVSHFQSTDGFIRSSRSSFFLLTLSWTNYFGKMSRPMSSQVFLSLGDYFVYWIMYWDHSVSKISSCFLNCKEYWSSLWVDTSWIFNDQGHKTMIIHPCLLGKVLFYAYHLYQKHHLIFKSVLVWMINYMVILYTTQSSNGWERLITSLYGRLMIMKDCWIGKKIIPIFYVPFLMTRSGSSWTWATRVHYHNVLQGMYPILFI